MSCVRASAESFKTIVFHALEGKRFGCLVTGLRNPSASSLARPCPASSHRRAPLRTDPAGSKYRCEDQPKMVGRCFFCENGCLFFDDRDVLRSVNSEERKLLAILNLRSRKLQVPFFFRALDWKSQKPVESKTLSDHGRVGAGRRTAGRRGGTRRSKRDVDGSVRPGDTGPSCSPGHRRQLSRTSLRKHEQTKSM